MLKAGTEQAYSAVTWNPAGDQLASVGSYPDYMLTIWDWQQERMVLRSKAFSQEVFNVAFSSSLQGVLHTSGETLPGV